MSFGAAPSSPVLYLSKIEELNFETLKQKSSAIEKDEYLLNIRLVECSSFLHDRYAIHIILLVAAMAGKSLEDTLNWQNVTFLGILGLLWIYMCIMKYTSLLSMERKGRLIQLEKGYFCLEAENFVRRSEGVEGGIDAATKSGLELEYARIKMISMKKLHSNKVKSYYWVFWTNLAITVIYLSALTVGCVKLIHMGRQWFYNASQTSTTTTTPT